MMLTQKRRSLHKFVLPLKIAGSRLCRKKAKPREYKINQVFPG
jgi:hypothetical protein